MDHTKTVLIEKIMNCYQMYFDGKENAYIINNLINEIISLAHYGCGMIGTVTYNDDKCVLSPIGMTNTGWTSELFDHTASGKMQFTMDSKNDNIFVKTMKSHEPLVFNNVKSYYSQNKDYRPENHPQLTSFIGCVFDIDNVVGYINFANKHPEFNNNDVEYVRTIIQHISPLIYYMIKHPTPILVQKYMVPDILYLAMEAFKKIIIINKFGKVFFSMGDATNVISNKIPIGDSIIDHIPQLASYLLFDKNIF